MTGGPGRCTISSIWQAAQIQGARQYQEDFYAVVENGRLFYKGQNQPLATGRFPSHLSLFLLTDGMGGMGHGDLAAAAAIEAFIEAFLQLMQPDQSLQAGLQQSAQMANQAIADLVTEEPLLKGMGCTLIALVWNNLEQVVEWLSIGDSLLYLLRRGGWRKLNQEHTLGWLAQTLPPEELPVTKEDLPGLEGLLCSAVDGNPISHIDQSIQPLSINPGDILVIASDGLTTLEEQEIEQIVVSSTTDTGSTSSTNLQRQLQTSLEQMFSLLAQYNRPKQDNTTIILLGFTEADQGHRTRSNP